MNHRANLMRGALLLLGFFFGSPIEAADSPSTRPGEEAVIYFSFAPWDGTAYAIDIPLENADPAVQSVIRINIWGYPEFSEAKTINFSGKEDAGGGPSKGDGRAVFQADFNKSMPENLMGSVSFKTLQNGHPVSGIYEFTTLDGKRNFKGSFRARWGNNPPKLIR